MLTRIYKGGLIPELPAEGSGPIPVVDPRCCSGADGGRWQGATGCGALGWDGLGGLCWPVIPDSEFYKVRMK